MMSRGPPQAVLILYAAFAHAQGTAGNGTAGGVEAVRGFARAHEARSTDYLRGEGGIEHKTDKSYMTYVSYAPQH